MERFQFLVVLDTIGLHIGSPNGLVMIFPVIPNAKNVILRLTKLESTSLSHLEKMALGTEASQGIVWPNARLHFLLNSTENVVPKRNQNFLRLTRNATVELPARPQTHVVNVVEMSTSQERIKVNLC